AARGRGACARDLTRVCGRIRQGLSEIEALREWSATVRVEALERITPVLALNREATDLGRLISEEARAIRRDVQRQLIESDEKGEGVISAAIAVLIMAFLGAGMWLAFNTIFKGTAKNTCEQTKAIGGPDNTADCSSVGQ